MLIFLVYKLSARQVYWAKQVLWDELWVRMHSRSRAGFTPSGVPDQKKMWGPLLYEYPATAFTRHAQSSSTFFWDPCCNANYYWGHTKSFPLFPDHYFFISGLLPCCKKWKMCFCGGHLFVGPLFGRTCWTCLNPPLSRKLRSQCTWSMLWSLYHYSTSTPVYCNTRKVSAYCRRDSGKVSGGLRI